MLKVALIAAALAAAPPVDAGNADQAALSAPAPEPGAVAASTPAAGADWAPLPPPRGTGLDFKDAAAEPASLPPPDSGDDTRHRAIPALLALGALVVLLRKRPA